MKIPKNIHIDFTVHGYREVKFSHLEGRIKTLIETLGLPEKQEKSFKDLVTKEIWDMWERPHYSYHYQQNGLEEKLI